MYNINRSVFTSFILITLCRKGAKEPGTHKSQEESLIPDHSCPQAFAYAIYPAAAAAKSLQSCLTLCDSIDGSPPGSSVHGILRARVLEWGAIAFS